MNNAMTDADTIFSFMTAGNATFTLTSTSGKHFTYKVQKPKNKKDDPTAPLFVRVLSHGYESYSYLGTVFPTPVNKKAFIEAEVAKHGQPDLAEEALQGVPSHTYKARGYRHSNKSPIAPKSPAEQALIFLLLFLEQHGRVPETLTFQHAGTCGRCGRKLTDPNSINIGLGPECAGH